jgi:Kef-type K+ transport system membrane component KefB
MSVLKIQRASVAIISVFGALLAGLLSFYALFPWTIDRAGLDFARRFGISALMSALAIACIFTVVQFVRGRKWAWWSTQVVAAMILAFGLLCLCSAFSPTNDFERSEADFLLMAGIVFAIPSIITGALLNVPPVRRRFLG